MTITYLFLEFGLVLGNKIYVKDVGAKLDGNSLQEGDILLKINNHYTDGMSLKDAKKMIECTKEKLNLVVRREPRNVYPVEPTVHNSKGLKKCYYIFFYYKLPLICCRVYKIYLFSTTQLRTRFELLTALFSE